jgi:thimet oligopeptidase
MTQSTSAPVEVHAWLAGGAESAAALTAWVDARMKAYEDALAALLAVPAPRTIANSLTLYDAAIEQLNLAGCQAGLLHSVAVKKSVRDEAQNLAQRVSAAGAALSLNRSVYEALVAIDLTGATPATKHYVERTLLSYRLAGVDKDQATRDRLQALHEKATMLSLEFGRNIQEGTKSIEATPEELAGLPEDFLALHQPNAQGKITLTTDQPEMLPVMTYAESAALRERMFLVYNTRAYPANRQLLLDLLATRQEIARTLGFRSWADLATADQMMGSAANVRAFLAKLDAASLAGGRAEHEKILAFARQRDPKIEEIEIFSRSYWYELYRRSAYAFDSQSVRPYFPYEQVEAGVLEIASRLFKIEFRPSTTPAWHESVTVYEVVENGQTVGRFYLDMHPREGKSKWFSAAPVVTGVRNGAMPEAALICNFPGGEQGDPGLLQYSNVVTFFHEFGHLMHAILGGQTEWIGLSGFATEGDFIEVPSMMLEEFFRDASILQIFAKHYQTGETLSTEIIEKMVRAGAFGRADGERTQIYYTTLSLDVHDLPAESIDPDEAIERLYKQFLPWTWSEGSRMYASFGHLTGYSSNYYTYAYDLVIALDFFAQFDPKNLLGGEAGARYRKTVLEQGGSKPGRQMVREFLGRDEEFSAFTHWMEEANR